MMRRFSPAVVAALLAAFALPAIAAAPPLTGEVTPAVAERMDTLLQAATGGTKGLTPALSVAVVRDGRVVYARAFGVSDVTTKAPATTQTRFRIASVTKMITAVAVMQLVEAGRVQLDAPLKTYLPGAPHASEVTIRQLLMHTSGLWNYGDDAVVSGRVAMPTTPGAIIAALAERPLVQKPGSGFSYSNTGYVLLGLVVEAVSHRSLAAYEREHIFGPAKMNDTTIGEPPPDVPAARGYMDATGTAPGQLSLSWFYADGDIVSTASDVARFDIALMDGRLVKPATFAEMQSSAVLAPPLGKGTKYGLGLMIVPTKAATFVGHHGGLPGFEADTNMVPAERYAVVVLSDALDFGTGSVENALVAQTLPSLTARAVTTAPSAGGSEDAAITATFRTFLTGVQRGVVDPATLDDKMRSALTPQALSDLTTQFAPLGTLQSLTFDGKKQAGPYVAFHYLAKFSSGQTVPVTLSLDRDGKIAGFGAG